MKTNQFQNSFIDMIVLNLLQEHDMYGYEMIEEIASRSENACDIKAGTLYPILAALTKQGYVEPYENLTPQNRVRKYYRLTQEGRDALDEKREAWREWSRLMNRLAEI